MDYRRQGPACFAQKKSAGFGYEKKTSEDLIDEFDGIWDRARPAFKQDRTFHRTHDLALSSLVCLGRRTISGLLTTAGRQFADWSADYRVFEHGRFRCQGLFDAVRQGVGEELTPNDPLVVAMDDTLLRKKGRKIDGASWRRDPLGPPFRPNFIWGQRFLQLSAAIPEGEGFARARAVPVDLTHCPSPAKPKKNAPAADWAAYKEKQKEMRVSKQGAHRLWNLRAGLDKDEGGRRRRLIITGDGGFTNETVLKALPPRTTYIGRIRKDAKIYDLPSVVSDGPGRKRVYGKQLPTPEEIRRDDQISWIPVRAWAAGKVHSFEVKTLCPIRWRKAGARDLRLIVIRPLAYRPKKGADLLYRKPAYLICTDPDLPLEKLLQYYIWRWEIELNFRDEKTLLGVGQAQVWTKKAAVTAPSLLVAAYAMLLLATHRVFGTSSQAFPAPKWRRNANTNRVTTAQAIGLLRSQLWGKALGISNFSDFVKSLCHETKPEKLQNQLQSALLYGVG